ncbi:uncharacterized protein LOC143290997 [Babylonia areolata]|uniref:uncharacterized protein LOC143290997 n=1 Tax=Babylonia areolata TaxID=304850 RepID=UPI003FCF868E
MTSQLLQSNHGPAERHFDPACLPVPNTVHSVPEDPKSAADDRGQTVQAGGRWQNVQTAPTPHGQDRAKESVAPSSSTETSKPTTSKTPNRFTFSAFSPVNSKMCPHSVLQMKMKILLFFSLLLHCTTPLQFSRCTKWPGFLTSQDQTACKCDMDGPVIMHEGDSMQLQWRNDRNQTLAFCTTGRCAECTMALTLPLSALLLNPRDSGKPFSCVKIFNGQETDAATINVPNIAFGPKHMMLSGPAGPIGQTDDAITLSCTVVSNPEPSMEWTHTPASALPSPIARLTRFEFTQTLTFDPRSYSDGDVIKCAASNPKLPGSRIEASYLLHFKAEVELVQCTQQPQHVNPEDDSACTCSFTPSPPFTHTWTLSWADHRGNTLASDTSFNSTLTLPLPVSLIRQNGFSFTCLAANENGVYSKTQYLPVIAGIPLHVNISSSVSYLPEDDTQMTLTCSAHGDLAMKFTWTGAPASAVIGPRVEGDSLTFSQTLTFDSKDVRDGDVVKCTVTNSDYPSLFQQDTHTLRRAPRPVLKDCVEPGQYITADMSTVCTAIFTLPSTFTLPAPTFTLTWLDPEGHELLRAHSSTLEGGSPPELVLPLDAALIAPEYSGLPFVCRVSTEGGKVFSAPVVFVPTLAPKPELRDCLGEDEFITPVSTSVCTAVLSPTHLPRHHYTLAWEDPTGQILTYTDTTSTLTQSPLTLTLDASLVRPEHSGLPFVCRVSTEQGEFSNVLYVPNVAYGPGQVSIVSHMPQDRHQPISLHFLVKDSNPAPVVEWTGVPHGARHSDCSPQYGMFCAAVSFPASAVPEGYSVTCSARNPYLEDSVMEDTVTVASVCTNTGWGPMSAVCLALGIVALVAVLCAVTLAVCLAISGGCCKSCRRRDRDTELLEECEEVPEEKKTTMEAKCEEVAETTMQREECYE